MLPKQLVEAMLARIHRWVGGEDVQLSNLSCFQDLTVFELVTEEHKAILKEIRQSILGPEQAGR